jgi:hypothetical protein
MPVSELALTALLLVSPAGYSYDELGLKPGYIVAASPIRYPTCARALEVGGSVLRRRLRAHKCARSRPVHSGITDVQCAGKGVATFLWHGRRYWTSADAITRVHRRFRGAWGSRKL